MQVTERTRRRPEATVSASTPGAYAEASNKVFALGRELGEVGPSPGNKYPGNESIAAGLEPHADGAGIRADVDREREGRVVPQTRREREKSKKK